MTDDALDYGRFEALTFDCYGTLVDWETGILTGLRAALRGLAVAPPDDELLERYSQAEGEAEGGRYLPYREVVANSLRVVCRRYGIEATDKAAADFGASVGDWLPFPDSVAALARLKSRYRLGVITNCDDDLFATTNGRLGVEFDWIVTAQSVGSYKPDPRNFLAAFDRIDLPRERILHVAQSLFHDHAPARRLGLASVWIDRRHGRAGSGASPWVEAHPEATFPDMASFAGAATRA